jgi:hypothetical protein
MRRASLAHCSSSKRTLPSSVLAKSHRGLRQSCCKIDMLRRLFDAALKLGGRFQRSGLRCDQAEYHRFVLGHKTQGLKTAGALRVEFHEVAIRADLVEQYLCYGIIATRNPARTKVTTAQVHRDGHIRRPLVDRTAKILPWDSPEPAACSRPWKSPRATSARSAKLGIKSSSFRSPPNRRSLPEHRRSVRGRYTIKPRADSDIEDYAGHRAQCEPRCGATLPGCRGRNVFPSRYPAEHGWHARLRTPALGTLRMFRVAGFERMLILYRPLEDGVADLRINSSLRSSGSVNCRATRFLGKGIPH